MKDGTVFTHPRNQFILPGITQQVVIDICGDLNIPLKEEAVSLDDLELLDEAFLTGTTTQVQPIGTIIHGEREIGLGNQPGPLTGNIQKEYYKIIESL